MSVNSSNSSNPPIPPPRPEPPPRPTTPVPVVQPGREPLNQSQAQRNRSSTLANDAVTKKGTITDQQVAPRVPPKAPSRFLPFTATQKSSESSPIPQPGQTPSTKPTTKPIPPPRPNRPLGSQQELAKSIFMNTAFRKNLDALISKGGSHPPPPSSSSSSSSPPVIVSQTNTPSTELTTHHPSSLVIREHKFENLHILKQWLGGLFTKIMSVFARSRSQAQPVKLEKGVVLQKGPDFHKDVDFHIDNFDILSKLMISMGDIPPGSDALIFRVASKHKDVENLVRDILNCKTPQDREALLKTLQEKLTNNESEIAIHRIVGAAVKTFVQEGGFPENSIQNIAHCDLMEIREDTNLTSDQKMEAMKGKLADLERDHPKDFQLLKNIMLTCHLAWEKDWKHSGSGGAAPNFAGIVIAFPTLGKLFIKPADFARMAAETNLPLLMGEDLVLNNNRTKTIGLVEFLSKDKENFEALFGAVPNAI